MSRIHRSKGVREQDRATVFAALGDPTRLTLVAKLSGGQSYSISQLTSDSRLTRQAITKHLRVLESVGIVRCTRSGRERRFKFEPQPIDDIRDYLGIVSKQWDDALCRLKELVEE